MGVHNILDIHKRSASNLVSLRFPSRAAHIVRDLCIASSLLRHFPPQSVIDLDDEYQEGDLAWVETPLNPTGEARNLKHYADKASALYILADDHVRSRGTSLDFPNSSLTDSSVPNVLRSTPWVESLLSMPPSRLLRFKIHSSSAQIVSVLLAWDPTFSRQCLPQIRSDIYWSDLFRCIP